MSKCAWIVVALLAVLSSGCVTMQSSEKYQAYRDDVDKGGYLHYVGMTLKDLALDVVDVASAELSFGPGLLADVQPTKVLEIGGGYADITKMGWRKRAGGYYREMRKEGGLSGVYYRQMDVEPIYGTEDVFTRPRAMRDFAIRHNNDRHWADIGAQVHVVAIGASVYVSPLEAVDAIVDVVALPYNLIIRPLCNHCGFRPPEIDLGDDDTTAQARKKVDLNIAKPEEGFPPAEKVDELFRHGY